MNLLAYYLHSLNPIIFSVHIPLLNFDLQPRWYGLAYLLGFLVAYRLLLKLSRDGMLRLHKDRVADFVLNACIFGVLIGGRLGFVLFYDLPASLHAGTTPLLWDFSSKFPYWGLFDVMNGGMSAHGGIIFTICTLIFLGWKWRKEGASIVNLGDASCMVVPVGLFFGRIANFINGELYGHPSSVPWAVQFPSEFFSPTNGDQTLPDAAIDSFQSHLSAYVQAHPQDLTDQQALNFLQNHTLFHGMMDQRFGTPDPHGASQMIDLKNAIAQYLADPSNLSRADIAYWWQHSTVSLHQLMAEQFAAILPRHPSQLYEALLEGLLLFIIVWTIGRLWRKDGMAGGAFLTFYPIMRIIGEQFRVGDTSVSLLGAHISAGVFYSLLMLIPAVIYWGYWIRRDRRIPWVPAAERPAPDTPSETRP